eukprot:Skav228077  [mRNA]  locus=scaffold5285:42433:43656:- [translate_table: standard]
MAETIIRRLEYHIKVERAGIMPCLHVAVVRGGKRDHSCSSGSSTTCVSYEHHAIFDRRRSEYIHVSSTDDNDEMRVIRTGKQEFERNSLQPARVVKVPASMKAAQDILCRARTKAEHDHGAWEYGTLWRNCEHFVNECWDPEEPPPSSQAENAVAGIGGSSALGAVGAGTGATIAAAAVQCSTVTTNTYWALGFIPWGTTSTTVVSGLPVATVIGIAAGGTLAGAGLLGGIAYGVRELALDQTAQNAQLPPIAIYNTSGQNITASLEDREGTFADAWRSFLGIGVMSLEISSGMAEELNPPTVTDSGDLVLTVVSQTCKGQVHVETKVSCQVSRGDVVTFDGQTLEKEDYAVVCNVCLDRRPNVVLQPCEHWAYCEHCLLQLGHRALVQMERPKCPECRQDIESYMT